MSANLMSLARSGGKFLKLFGDRKMVKTMPTAKDYVQDGLIAMWDGIENAGFAADGYQHDSNATKIVNLCGTGDLNLYGNVSIGDDTVFFNGGYGEADFAKTISETTIERVSDYKIEYNNSQTRILSILSGTVFCAGIHTFSSNVLNNYAYSTGSYNRRNYLTSLNPKCVSCSKRALYLDREDVGGSTTPNIVAHDTDKVIVAASTDKTATRKWSFRCIRIYDRELSDSEVMKNCAIDKARFNLTTPTI